MKRLFLTIAALLMLACAPAEDPADLVVVGGRIVTMDPSNPEVEALAARGGVLVAVGGEREVRRLIGRDTEVIDLGDALAVPGLIEGHGHFMSLGRSKMELDLGGARNFDAIVAMVAKAAENARPGEWIFGRGWHQEKWVAPPQPNVSGLPYHDALSRVTPENPVLLTHASGHATLVNKLALELAGIDRSTPDPPGGEIVRDRTGRVIGVLRENAEKLVDDVIDNRWDEATLRRMAELASAECVAHGITSFQDAGSPFDRVDLLVAMANANELDTRLWIMLSEDNQTLKERLPGYRVFRAGRGFVTVGGIKRWIDGALGSHGAWLLEPYSDLPTSTGLNTLSPEELRESARIAMEHGLQLCSHAIGDRANRVTLDVYEEAIRRQPNGTQRRWRIEHAQHLDPNDIPRFARLGVIAAMQPVHCTSDGPWVAARLGDRRAELGAYVWRKILDTGAIIVGGTDVPVEPIDPVASFVAAVTRQLDDGSFFYPGQCMSREEALRCLTIDAAYGAFEEDVKGSLEVGKYADVTVLSQDILTVPVEEIANTNVLYTIVDGRVRYRIGISAKEAVDG